MSTDLLFEHFATLATAPDGIAHLRELILQLAVQGKLGTQDAGDEPAPKLVERIRKEKERLVKEGKIKKDKPLKMSDFEEPPCLLPKTWVWTRLSEVGLVNPRNYDIADNEEVSFIPMTLIPVGYKKPAQQEIKKWGEIKAGFTHFADNDVVMAKITPCFQNGKSVVLKNLKNGVGAGTTELHVFRAIKNLVNPEYVLLFLKTPEFLETGIRRMTGSAGQKRVPNEYFSETPFPLPPLAEQNRIIAKVDRFMTICDELEARQQKERAGCLKLGTASLAKLQNAENPEEFERQWVQVCDAFDLILDCPENVAVLRQTILQMAVQGRLVRHVAEDESAGKLVDRIRKEKDQLVKDGKIGKTKLTPEIESEEIPYPVPKNWIWTRLDHITYISTGSTPSTSTKEYYIGGNIPWVTSSLTSQKLIFNADMKITEKAVQDCSLKVYPEGTLLVALYGQGKTRGQVSELGISATINQACSAIVFWKNNEPVKDYLKLVLTGNYEKIRSISAGGAQPNLNGNKIKRMLVPLPPLAEQSRIVAKVDALMVLCDALESRLKERAGVQSRLAGAVVKMVAG
jgi:type I restriction enzyme, S subunit